MVLIQYIRCWCHEVEDALEAVFGTRYIWRKSADMRKASWLPVLGDRALYTIEHKCSDEVIVRIEQSFDVVKTPKSGCEKMLQLFKPRYHCRRHGGHTH